MLSNDKFFNVLAEIVPEERLLNANFFYLFETADDSFDISWRSGYCYLNKGEYDLNQSKEDSFVKRVAENNN